MLLLTLPFPRIPTRWELCAVENLQEGELCDNTCGFPADNACDDGGPGSTYSECDFGTDCSDCGLRIQSPAAPPAPPAAPPSQASAASQPFVYDLAGSSSDEEDGGAAHAAKRARLSEESSRSLPSSFFCAISHSVMRDPVVCADGMTYERAYIESWLLAHDTSPLTNQPLAHKLLVPNIALKQAIGEMLERV